MDNEKKFIHQYIDDLQQELFSLSDSIWEQPEIRFHEYESAKKLIGCLRKHGFTVEENLAGIPTAFKAVFGEGSPVIGILGEFDALDGMCQVENVFFEQEKDGSSLGHGCGHHLLGSASVYAVVGVKKYLEKTGKKGTIVFFGCPAEEGGSGKSFMVREGIFSDVDCALTWHPADHTGLFTGRCLANISATFKFTGVSAHAAGLAYLGKSALDAVELMNVGSNFLREHIVPDARIHYAITDAGGSSPNVVQSHASVFYYVRAPKPEQVIEIYQRVQDIAKGAALMTGTQMECIYNRGVNSLMPNTVMNTVLQRNMEQTEKPEYSEDEYTYAKKYRDTLPSPETTFEELVQWMTPEERKQIDPDRGKAIYEIISPQIQAEPLLFGSTDVGDVSMVCPTAQIHVSSFAAGTPLHSWQLVAQGKSSLSHKGELFAAKILAGAAIDLLEHPETIAEAKAELAERLGTDEHPQLLPNWVKPPID